MQAMDGNTQQRNMWRWSSGREVTDDGGQDRHSENEARSLRAQVV